MGHFSLIQIFPTELSSTRGLVRLSNFYSSTSKGLSCMCTSSLFFPFHPWFDSLDGFLPDVDLICPFSSHGSPPSFIIPPFPFSHGRRGISHLGVGAGCPPCSYDVCCLLFISVILSIHHIYVVITTLVPFRNPGRSGFNDGSSRQLPYSPLIVVQLPLSSLVTLTCLLMTFLDPPGPFD